MFGGLVASSVILSVPVRAPVATGVNVMLMVQPPPGATLPPQVSVSAKSEPFEPVTAIADTVKSVFPVLFSGTLCAALVAPTTPANVTPEGEKLAIRVTATPVPESGTGIELGERLFAIAKPATNMPVPVGAKVTWIEQLAPPAKFPTQLLFSARSEAFAPFIEMPSMVSPVESLLVSVTVWDALVVPTGWFANVKVPVVGSYSSALAKRAPVLSALAATRTFPLFSKVAVKPERATFILPVKLNVSVAGLYNSALGWC